MVLFRDRGDAEEHLSVRPDFFFLAYLFPACVHTHTHTHTIHMRGKNGKLSLNKSPSGRLMTPLKSRVIFVLYLTAILLGRN